MCAIFGSFEKQTLMDLYNKNKYRGNFSFSITSIDTKTLKSSTNKFFGEMDEKQLDNCFVEGRYHICHTQAPTNVRVNDFNRIHPVQIDDYKLLHNGIIVSDYNIKLKEKYNTGCDFDTFNLAAAIKTDGYSVLNDMQGSFACVEITEHNYPRIFRNENSILCTDGVNISSAKLKGYTPIIPNQVYKIDFNNGVDGIEIIESFNNKYTNFYFE